MADLDLFYTVEHRSVGPYGACICGMRREVKVRYNDFYGDGSLKWFVTEAHATGLSLSLRFWSMFPPGLNRDVSITHESGEFIHIHDSNALILLRDGDTIINHPRGTYAA